MLQSQLFTKTRKEAPKDEVSKNAQLLTRAGFVEKLHAGVYSYLPLGLRVLEKIEAIVRDECLKAGAQEIFMPALHPKEIWVKTGRWDTVDVLYKFEDASGKEVALGPTHEEVVVPLAKQFVSSYKDLPFSVFQFQNKFRKELRAKSGLLRLREFVMKDMYSFHRDEEDLHRFYEGMKTVYADIFKHIGIGRATHLTFASGGTFSQFSHEFQTEIAAGEDVIYICSNCGVAVNNEVIAVQSVCPACGGAQLRSAKAIEVGNIFELKTKYAEPFALTYKNEQGKDTLVQMGCYGIGPARAMAAAAELFVNDNGMIWPEAIAPFKAQVIAIMSGANHHEVRAVGHALYQALLKRGVETLYDDRDLRAGEKFADADLIGIPHRVIVSEKLVAEQRYEYLNRLTGEKQLLDEQSLLRFLLPTS